MNIVHISTFNVIYSHLVQSLQLFVFICNSIILTYFNSLTRLVVDSEVAMDPGIAGIHRERPGGQGDIGNTGSTGFIDFVNVGIFKANFTWVPFNLVRFIRILRGECVNSSL